MKLQGRGDHEGCIRVCTEMAEIARRSGNDRGLASALGNTAVSLYYLGRNDQALPLLTEQIAPAADDRRPCGSRDGARQHGRAERTARPRRRGARDDRQAEQLARAAGHAQFATQIAALAEQIRRR